MLTIHHRQALRAVAQYSPARPRHRPIKRLPLYLLGVVLVLAYVGAIELGRAFVALVAGS